MTNINEYELDGLGESVPDGSEELMSRLISMGQNIDKMTLGDIGMVFELLPEEKRQAAWRRLTDLNAITDPHLANIFLTEYSILFFVQKSKEQIEQVNTAFRKSLALSSKAVVADVQQEMRVEGANQVQAIREAGEEVTQELKEIQAEIKASIDGVLAELGTLKQLEESFGERANAIKEDLEAIQTAIKDGPEKMAEAARLSYQNVLYKENATALTSVKEPIVEYAKGELRKFFSESVDERNWRQNFKAFLWSFAGSAAALVAFSVFFSTR